MRTILIFLFIGIICSLSGCVTVETKPQMEYVQLNKPRPAPKAGVEIPKPKRFNKAIRVNRAGEKIPEPPPMVAPRSAPTIRTVGNPRANREIVLMASGAVTITVTDVGTGEKYFNGEIEAGSGIAVKANGPIAVLYSKGSLLTYEKEGRVYPMNRPALGKDVIR